MKKITKINIVTTTIAITLSVFLYIFTSPWIGTGTISTEWKKQSETLVYDGSDKNVTNNIYEDAQTKVNNINNMSVYFVRNTYSAVQTLFSSFLQQTNPEKNSIIVLYNAQGYIVSDPNWNYIDNLPNMEVLHHTSKGSDKWKGNYFRDLNGAKLIQHVDKNYSKTYNFDLYFEDLHTSHLLWHNTIHKKLTNKLLSRTSSINFMSEGTSSYGQLDRTEYVIKSNKLTPDKVNAINSKKKNISTKSSASSYFDYNSGFMNRWTFTDATFKLNHNNTNYYKATGPDFAQAWLKMPQQQKDHIIKVYNIDLWDDSNFVNNENYIVTGSRVEDNTMNIILKQIKNNYDKYDIVAGGKNILFKGHPGQSNPTHWFTKLKNEVLNEFGSNDWFHIIPHQIPMEMYFATQLFTSDANTKYNISVDGASTVLAGAIESNALDSINQIQIAKKFVDMVEDWYGEISPTNPVLTKSKVVII